ncbi:histone H3.v1-like [Candoia aspera]|uniref:histone H3.v1-like n=1 Tax=Candoia aspera TaxID=51853 RepID=UPI002FD81A25
MAVETIEDQKTSDEEETCASSEDENKKDCDENKDSEKEEEKEQDATEYYDDHALDEEQGSILCENEEKNVTNMETMEKDNPIPDNDPDKQACENAEIHTKNNSSQAIVDNQDRTSGRLLDKAKRFSFFKRRSMKQKNAHSCDESEKLPQGEQDTGNQASVSAEKSKDENQNHTGKNQRGSPSTYQNRKSSSTCIIL